MICRMILMLGCFWSLLASFATANPTQDAPTASLDIHGICRFSKELAAFCEQLDGKLAPRCRAYAELTRSSVDRLPVSELGSAYSEASQMRRYAELLIMNVEPSGVDYRFRSVGHINTIQKAIDAARRTPSGRNYYKNVREQLKRQSVSRVQIGRQLRRLIGQGDWYVAEQLLLSSVDKIEPMAAWETGAARGAVYQPFQPMMSEITSKLKELRTVATRKQLMHRRDAAAPDIDTFVSLVLDSVNDFSRSDSTTIDGKSFNGPEVIPVLVEHWSNIHRECVRCRAIEWAAMTTGMKFTAGEGYGDARGEKEDPGSEWIAKADDILDLMNEGIAQIIMADASRLSGNDASDRYFQYLETMANLKSQIRDDLIFLSAEESLMRLIENDEKLEKPVKNYRRGMTELLRWRAFAAEAEARRRQTEFHLASHVFQMGNQSDSKYLGLAPAAREKYFPPKLRASMPDVMPFSVTRIMNQKATVNNVVSNFAKPQQRIGRYSKGIYSRVLGSIDTTASIDSLRNEMLVAEGMPPLSLVVSTALRSAEQGKFAACGGEIVGVQMESLFTKFLVESSGMEYLVGSFPSLGDVEIDYMLMRFDLQPTWVRHEYFVAEVAVATD